MTEMSQSDLLVLLHAAVDRTTTLTGELRTWSHTSRSQRAFQVARSTSMGGGMFHSVVPRDGVEETEALWKVCVGLAGRYRLDLLSEPTTGAWALPPGSQGCDGERSWLVGQDAVHLSRASGSTLGRLLDPAWLLTHDLAVTEEGELSGRAVARVRATARPSRSRSGGAADVASERDLVVDAERGFLHSDTALVDGEAYDVMELRELMVDAEVDTTLFEPEIPPGLKVWDQTKEPPAQGPWKRRKRWHVR